MKPSAGALLAASVVALGAAPACTATPLPGQMLGTFKVTAQAKTNTCGLAAPDPWAFDIELSRDGNTLYWSWLDGSALLSGAIAASQASLTSQLEANVDATDAGPGPCTMMRTDNVDVALADAARPATFTGTIAYAFASVAGADCADQLTAAGGQYGTLPCAVSYTMTAARQ